MSAYLGLIHGALLYEDEGALQAAAELADGEILRGGHGAADLAHQDDAPPACGEEQHGYDEAMHTVSVLESLHWP